MVSRHSIIVAGVLTSLACAPAGPTAVDDSTTTDSGTTESDGGESESETGESDDPPLPSMCGEPHHEFTTVEQATSWETAPPSTMWIPDLRRCNDGLDPKFVIDGESLVIAYRNEYCPDEPGPEGEELPPEKQLVIGTETAGTWETAARDYGHHAEYMQLEADGTVRVAVGDLVYERVGGQWHRRIPESGTWAILADVEGGPDYALNVSYGVAHGRMTGDLAEVTSLVQPYDEPYTTMTWMSTPDVVRAPSGVPHLAVMTSTWVPNNWDPVATELRLLVSHASEDGWAYEDVGCWIGHLDGFSVASRPDLEIDANGDTHLCIAIDRTPERGVDISYHTNAGGVWTEEMVGEGSAFHPCQLELDGQGRVHMLTRSDYLVREDGVWSTIWTFERDAGASMEVSDDGTVYILRDGLSLLTNASGQWEERIITGDPPP